MSFVHVNVNTIKSNRKKLREGQATRIEDLEPPVTAKPNRHSTGPYARRIGILDAQGNVVAETIYDPFHPLPCGAVAYIECPFGTKVLE